MKKHLLKASMLIAVSIVVFGCSKEEEELVQPEFAGESNQNVILSNNLILSESCETVTFDKVTKDNRGFMNGVMSDKSAKVIGVQAFQRTGVNTYSETNVANIFDSGQPTPVPDHNQIDDILTPNKQFLPAESLFGGISTDGSGSTNNIPLGNVMIINRTTNPAAAFDYNQGGKIVFDFSAYGTVALSNISVVDVDSYEGASNVLLYDMAGNQLKKVAIPAVGDNGKAIVDLGGTSGVVKMEVYLGPGIDPKDAMTGSGTVDNITFNCLPKVYGCTYTQGYWKTHATGKKADPTWGNLANSIFYGSGLKYLELMNTAPKGGNAYVQLAHQYIAAKLNVAKKTSTTHEVETALASALKYFAAVPDGGGSYLNTINSPYTTATKSELTNWAGILAAYNEGKIGPGHCN
ncbi:hypothetical protein ACFSJU_17280 [Paradesertivirga mongoliensis]|uniref:DUF4856 domain-containing protein n=1 Tax=Paradesertivirga mongoliensis TaxID=2100740 RepID=A0ABW4ZQG6_9SPHI|nr:hypothetical protein [Pedobacter mongoliensis]